MHIEIVLAHISFCESKHASSQTYRVCSFSSKISSTFTCRAFYTTSNIIFQCNPICKTKDFQLFVKRFVKFNDYSFHVFLPPFMFTIRTHLLLYFPIDALSIYIFTIYPICVIMFLGGTHI